MFRFTRHKIVLFRVCENYSSCDLLLAVSQIVVQFLGFALQHETSNLCDI